MYEDPRKQVFENKAKEALFLKRLAELRAHNAQFPWTLGEAPQFEISREESKLFAERAVEGPDVTDAQVEYQALVDLTSLSFNFKIFYRRLHYEIQRARRYRRDLSMCLVAIDNLEGINGTSGSEGKRAVIEEVARILLSSIRDVDIAKRCREDCFGIILPETPVTGAEIATVRISTKMEQLEIPTLPKVKRITVSIGGSSFPANGDSVDELFAHAASSLEVAMKSGGNVVSFAGHEGKTSPGDPGQN
jgi:diguanylate cyclase (GGDEF)-like protein